VVLVSLVLRSFVVVIVTPVVLGLFAMLFSALGSFVKGQISRAFPRSGTADAARVLRVRVRYASASTESTGNPRGRVILRHDTTRFVNKPERPTAVLGVARDAPEGWPAVWVGPHAPIQYN
jgi:hypothetical protein